MKKPQKPKDKQLRLNGAELIEAERLRQIHEEGFSAEHDDDHFEFELTRAAISYAGAARDAAEIGELPGLDDLWPWGVEDWKPSLEPIRNLVKAGALIAAEIDRLQRLELDKEDE